MNAPDRSRIWQVIIGAGRSALFFAGGLLALSLVFGKLSEILGGRRPAGFAVALELSAMAGVFWFCFMLFPFLANYSVWTPAGKLLDQLAAEPNAVGPPFSGFVAMEYYCLILNRTFVVFCLEEGLYGWKAQGPVSNLNPSYFHPYLELLGAPALMRSSETVRSLAKLPGGFFLPRSTILQLEFDPSSKWGMGGIPHSGKLKVRLASRKSREFILLGSVQGEDIRNQILSSC